MEDKEIFQRVVSQIVAMYDEEDIELEERIIELEDEIEQTGYGKAYFFITKGDTDEIDFGQCFKYKYYASYYDGMQAPFVVCGWNGTIDFLIELTRKHGFILNITELQILI